MTIFVGSTNPVKLNAVKTAVSGQWPDAQILGIEVKSGVGEQPMSDEETRQGARQRALKALTEGLSQHPTLTTEMLGIGLEGGVMQMADGLYSTVWVAVADQTGTIFDSNGARFRLPEKIAALIESGTEMGVVVGTLFKNPNVKQLNGMIGIVTRNFVDRTSEYASIAKLALGLWFGRDWEKDIPSA